MISQSAYAERIGISPQALYQRIKRGVYRGATRKINGIIKIDPDKAILCEDNIDIMKRVGGMATQKKHKGISQAEIIPESEPGALVIDKSLSMAEAQRLKAQYQAALLKLEHDEKIKTLVQAEDVRKTAFDMGRRLRDSLLNIPDRIADQLATMSDSMEINRLLNAEIRQALSAIGEPDI